MSKQRPDFNPFLTHALVLVGCLGSLVIAHGWASHELPQTAKVLMLSVAGMIVVGSYAGFAFFGFMALGVRVGAPKVRGFLHFAAWFALCFASYRWLVHLGGENSRSAVLVIVAGLFGMTVGARTASLLAGAWLLKRAQRRANKERDEKLAQNEKVSARARDELQRRFAAERLARLNAQERPNAIRNFMRS